MTMTKQQDFLDILTNPQQAEIRHKLDGLIQVYTELQVENPFHLKMVENPEYVFTIRITAEDIHILNKTEDWFRFTFPANKYPTLCYAPPEQYGPKRWTHYYRITKL